MIFSNIGNYTWIRAGTQIVNSQIGSDVFIGFKCKIINAMIQDNVEIASNCVIGMEGAKQVVLQKGCWIGADSVIKSGLNIGVGAVIGAGTVVENDIESFCIVVGKPGRVIKKRKCVMDYYPQFRKMFDSYFPPHKCKNENLISADLEMADNVKLGYGNILIGKKIMGGGIYCRNNVKIGNDNILESAGGIYIGAATKIGNKVHMISNSHDYKKLSLPMIFQPIKIGENVIIGDECVILGNVEIGDNQTIPSNSLIFRNI